MWAPCCRNYVDLDRLRRVVIPVMNGRGIGPVCKLVSTVSIRPGLFRLSFALDSHLPASSSMFFCSSRLQGTIAQSGASLRARAPRCVEPELWVLNFDRVDFAAFRSVLWIPTCDGLVASFFNWPLVVKATVAAPPGVMQRHASARSFCWPAQKHG